MDFNRLIDGLQGWPAATVLIVVIAAIAAVLIAYSR